MTCMYPPPHMTSVLSMQGSIDEINAVMPYMHVSSSPSDECLVCARVYR